MSKPTKAEMEKLLIERLREIVNDPSAKNRDIISACKLLGSEFDLFTEKKKVQVDIHALINNLSTRQLAQIAGSEVSQELDDVLEVELLGEGDGT